MKIIMLTDYRGSFRQGIKQFLSMDKSLIIESFERAGMQVVELNYEQLINENIILSNEIIIYTSTQNIKYKNYLDDILYALSKQNKLLPRYEVFKAHENKGYQEILKRELDIESLEFLYFGNFKGLERNSKLITKYPIILKKLEGAGSTNVFKVNDQKELFSLVHKLNRPNNHTINILKRLKNKFLMKKLHLNEYLEEDNFMGSYILQEFVNGLNDDWKILIFGSRYYVLNRKVRNNDFRASGSGKLSFVDPPEKVLNYAKSVFEKLDLPCVSLDIAYDGKEAYLIEFQGLHFGPYTIINSEYYFTFDHNEWQKVDENSKFEEVYAQSIIDYINKMKGRL
ncbi:MAG: hypothetical protein K8R73_01385 [Clostridiales bacterium]|nr:hypothetical protein [Clostridiales bacterium]